MRHKFIKVICGLILLGSTLTSSASADPLMLNFSGYFGPNSTLGGAAFSQDTAFSLTATFIPDSSVSLGLGVAGFSVTSYSVVINGTAYTGSPSVDLFVALADPRGFGVYAVGLVNSALDHDVDALYAGATPDFLAENPTLTKFTSFVSTHGSGDFRIPLDGVTGGLVINDAGAGDFAASITTIPEPSTFALLGLGALSFAAYRRKCAA